MHSVSQATNGDATNKGSHTRKSYEKFTIELKDLNEYLEASPETGVKSCMVYNQKGALICEGELASCASTLTKEELGSILVEVHCSDITHTEF